LRHSVIGLQCRLNPQLVVILLVNIYTKEVKSWQFVSDAVCGRGQRQQSWDEATSLPFSAAWYWRLA